MVSLGCGYFSSGRGRVNESVGKLCVVFSLFVFIDLGKIMPSRSRAVVWPHPYSFAHHRDTREGVFGICCLV